MFFFFNDTATTEIYTLSLHDALPICMRITWERAAPYSGSMLKQGIFHSLPSNNMTIELVKTGELTSGGSLNGSFARIYSGDRKSTRLNSSHGYISYAVFCLKKQKISH